MVSVDSKTPQTPPIAPLYQTICGAIQSDGTLPADFSLPRPKPPEEGKLRFADGAFDGISLYHMAPDQRDIKSLTEIVGLICAGSYDQAEECLILFFSTDEFVSMLPLIDNLQQWIIDNRTQIDPQHLYTFCLHLLKNSAHIESIKFALSCLELLNISEDTQVRNLIRVLALSNEFTLFCLYVMRDWSDSSDSIFDAAQHVSGWGRIHAVEALTPTSDAMRRWLLLQGWHNDVIDEYSALTCAEKTDLLGRLRKNDLDNEEWAAAGQLLSTLLNDGPTIGIDGLEEPQAMIDAYFAAAKTRTLSEAEAKISEEIQEKWTQKQSDHQE